MAEYFDRGQVILAGAPIASLQDGSIEVNNGFQEVVGMGG